jgi:peptidoglycan/LPS O-acetylase OafA/YrhL
MPEPVRGDQRYIPGLDGLRALAVAAVIAYHLGYGWAQGGLLGVGVFFTLSGYLITDILIGQWAARGRIKLGDFWLRRARRLLPALFVMLAVVAVWVNVWARSFLPGFRGDVIASALYVSNWWYIGQHASYYAQFAPPAPLDHLWSLAVEEQFYLVWPWVVLLLGWLAGRRRKRGTVPGDGAAGRDRASYLGGRARLALAGVTMALAAVSAIAMVRLYHPGYDPTRVYEGTDTRAFELLIGAAVAMVWPTRRPAGRPAPPAAARWLLDVGGVAGLVVIVLLVWRTNQYTPFMFRGGLVLLSMATALAVAAVVTPGSVLGQALGVRPVRWVGVRSYGMYLWHYPLIVLTAAAGTAGAAVSFPRAVALVAATVVVSAVSWRVVEEPIRRGLRRRPAAGRLPEGAAAAPAPGDAAGSPPARKAPAPRNPAGRRWSGDALKRALGTPLAAGGAVLLGMAILATGVTAAVTRLTPSPSSASAGLVSTAGNPSTASPHPRAGAAAAGAAKTGALATGTATPRATGTGAARTGPARTGSAGTGTPGTAPGASTPGASTPAAAPSVVVSPPAAPGRTSCTSVVHIGDSTSDGLFSSDYEPNPANRIPARYADVGVKNTIERVVGGTSIVETLPGTQNAYQMASELIRSGYHGCWVLALGTNDTADVYAGSNVGRVQRIQKMMALIGNQPVMWVEVKSLLSSGPYAEQNMLQWNAALAQELPHYPNMRLFDWPAVVQSSWFINDGIHYTSNGYLHRAQLIADALAVAFPAG